GSSGGISGISLNTWYHIVFTYDGTTARIYRNAGTPTSGVCNAPTWPAEGMYIGDRSAGSRQFHGIIDEVRLSNIVRSSAWVSTEYNNQNDPSGFYSIGTEEYNVQAPVISNEDPMNGATGVSIYLSQLEFNISDLQNHLLNYTITTIPDIIGGPQNGINVNSGTTASIPIINNPLNSNTLHTWYLNVTNGVHWTNKTFNFTTESMPDSWQFRKEILINHTKVTSDLINFPVLIHITDSDLAMKAQHDGDDIYFTDNVNNKLNHEIENYNGTTGELASWVNIPFLSLTQDTILYLYYGNPTCGNQESIEGTWDSNYVAVHHFDETSGTIYDSTSHNNDGTTYGNLSQDTQGKIDGADYFDGINDHITLPPVFSIDSQFTMEAWIYPQTGARYFVSQWNNYKGVMLQVGASPDHIEWYIDGSSGGISGISLNTWYHIVFTYDGTTARIYRNAGTPTSGVCNAPTWPAEGMYIGDRSAGSRQFHGIIDEVRLSNIVRSSAWVSTEYNNQNDPSGFYSIGTEEYNVQAPVISNEEPLNNVTGVSISLPSLMFDIFDYQDDHMTYTVTTIPDVTGGPQSGSNISSGTTINIQILQTPLEYNTLYTWSVHVTDGVYWTNETYHFTTSLNNGPIISEVYPNNQNATYNPRLTLKVDDFDNDSLTVIFKSNASGTWETLGTYHGGNKIYYHDPLGMDIKNKRFYWSANVFDGTTWINNTYRFTAQAFILKWSYYMYTNATIGPSASDVDHDGIFEIFAVSAGKIVCFNGKTGQVKWTYNYSGIGDHSQFEIGDLNKDGIEEVVVSTYSRTIALHANNGSVYWTSSASSSNKNIIIVDIDGNGYPYVYIASDDINHGENGTGRLRKLRGTDGTILAEVFAYRPCYGCLSCADSDNDGKFEIYMNDRGYSYTGSSLGKGMQCYDADTLNLLWYLDTPLCSSHSPILVDVNKDGILDAVCMNQHSNAGIYVIDGLTWDKMPGKWQDSISGLTAHSQPSIYDIDNDGNLELITCSGGPAMVWDMGRWSLDANLNYLLKEPPKMGNVIKDEKLEIIAAYNDIKIYNQSYQLKETINTPALAQTCVQDIDNNGRNELILMSESGIIKVYDTSGLVPVKLPRTNSEYYSERRTGAAVYIPPPGAPQPIIKETIPSNRSQDVQLNPTLCAHVIDFHYDRMNITISTNATGSWVTLASYYNVGNGWYNITTTTMNNKQTTYYWRVTATDPYADNMTTTKTYQFTTQTPPVISSIVATPSTILSGQLVHISGNVTDNSRVNTVKINILSPNGTATNTTALGGTPQWNVLKYDDFESGWGNYTDGGTDCALYTGTTYAHQGTKAADIRDYMDINSSFYLTQSIDVDTPRYIALRVDFWFKAQSMERRENLWVKYYDGQHWQFVADFLEEKHFVNDVFYHKIIWINETKYTFPKDMKIRFQCDASDDSDHVFIDQVYINATTAQGSHYYYNTSYIEPGTYHYYLWAQDQFGNSMRSATYTFDVSSE
ncbi:MAG: DUF2341 domain-containing protein, partial [Thermoplasmata archaeon]|nr:DUF2341 domain-containing protein [Thermoplasmata archaeon]